MTIASQEWAAWVGAAFSFAGPFLGVGAALWLYSRQRKDAEKDQVEQQLEALYFSLIAELDANREIIRTALPTIETVLDEQPEDIGRNDAIHDERAYIAPLFADSWEALGRTDARAVIPQAQLDQLFRYYSAVARANWLIYRVQRFQFRVPILEQLLETLNAVDDEKAGVRIDLHALRQGLVPKLQALTTRELATSSVGRESMTESSNDRRPSRPNDEVSTETG